MRNHFDPRWSQRVLYAIRRRTPGGQQQAYDGDLRAVRLGSGGRMRVSREALSEFLRPVSAGRRAPDE
jgi:hypothetical protein